MLSVRIDGREVETTPVSLARLVFDGRVDRHSPAKTPGTTAERSLEQSLESPHCEALSDELLARLRSMYASGSPEIDIQGLCEQVERLCQWHWANPHIAARFFWAAAWLNDVMDRLENAVEFYDLFLQTPSRESHLRLLAYNNRGVLRIRLGRLEGVDDLAQAAIVDSDGQADPQSAGLPAACFNLLNLINVALGSSSLTRVVDEELTAFFTQVPQDSRTLWLGSGSIECREDRPAGLDLADDSGSNLVILRDPTFKRLNALTARLALSAGDWAGGDGAWAANRLATGASQLFLWEARSNGHGHSGNGGAEGADRSVAGRYAYCAEAASLLLSEDIPSSLTRLESPLARAEQSVREELASIESCLSLNRYELAKSRLEVQRRILSSLDRRGRLAGLLARVDAQLERVGYLQSQSEQLDLQRACASMISAVEQFCRLTDLCTAQREYDDLVGGLGRIRSGLEPQVENEVAALLDELTARLNRHLHRLKRLEIRRSIRGSMRTLRRNWPTDWAEPVSEVAEKALAHCHVNDPQCCVEDWNAVKDRLDGHQGQYHLRKAMALLQAEAASWESVEDELVPALACKPDLWSQVAPLFGLLCPSQGESAAAVQMTMRAAAARLFDAGPEPDQADGLSRRAGGLLCRVFEQMQGRANRCMTLWRCVEATLSPVLERENPDAVAQAKDLAQRCLDAWPMGMTELPGRVDPRNPVNVFLESCDKARRLIEAGRLLNAQPPRWDEAMNVYSDLLDLGLDTRDQLKRAATGYYLAACHEGDARHVQRRILSGLEAWVAQRPQDAVVRIRRKDLMQVIAGLRAAADDGPNETQGGGHAPQEKGRSDA